MKRNSSANISRKGSAKGPRSIAKKATNSNAPPKRSTRKCTWCQLGGHNKQSCPDIKELLLKSGLPSLLGVKLRVCPTCKIQGHDRATCTLKEDKTPALALPKQRKSNSTSVSGHSRASSAVSSLLNSNGDYGASFNNNSSQLMPLRTGRYIHAGLEWEIISEMPIIYEGRIGLQETAEDHNGNQRDILLFPLADGSGCDTLRISEAAAVGGGLKLGFCHGKRQFQNTREKDEFFKKLKNCEPWVMRSRDAEYVGGRI